MQNHPKPNSGFTLVELLVVIGIIGVLIGILLPVLGRARSSAMTTQCLSNLRSIGQAAELYTNDNGGVALPVGCNWDNGGNCGVCVSVTGPDGNKVTAMVTDQCPG